MTINLLVKADGTKFGKSEKGAIYLDKRLTSPYAMYQMLINSADADLKNLYNYFSFKTLDEIDKILDDHQKEPFKKMGQKILAEEIITTIHGKEALISLPDSKIKVAIIPTDEEVMIARDAYDMLLK